MTKYIVWSTKDLEDRLDNLYKNWRRITGVQYIDTIISSECFWEVNLFLVHMEKRD